MSSTQYKNPFAEQCNRYAALFDKAYDEKNWEKTKSLIDECEKFLQDKATYDYAPIYYSLGTSYTDLAENVPEYDTEDIYEKVLYYYRIAIELLRAKELNNDKFMPYVKGIKLQLFTNYANALSHCQRKLAAIHFYRSSLIIKNDFKMAEGNMGIALLSYGALVHDPGHQNYLHYFAYNSLKSAIEGNDSRMPPEARNYFISIINGYDPEYRTEFLDKPLNMPEYSLGSTHEYAYRKWCLHNHIFLNPLNDLIVEHSSFAADTLQLPSIVTSISQTDIPIYFGLFNQLKQEYIYARYLFYRGIEIADQPHYADKDTYLVNLYDFPQYSIRVESIKTSFRLLYSLFDKVAFFINTYWQLGIKERDISFSSIWKDESGYRKYRYKHKRLEANENSAIVAINWIYKDFKKEFGDAPRPELQRLKSLRNAIEHKYVKVHSDLLYPIDKPYVDDEMTYHISESDLQDYTLELLQMIREVIIELTLAVHIEEQKKHDTIGKAKVVPKLYLDDYDDEWKI